jgi:hypothetical protein
MRTLVHQAKYCQDFASPEDKHTHLEMSPPKIRRNHSIMKSGVVAWNCALAQFKLSLTFHSKVWYVCNYRINKLVHLHYNQFGLTKHPTQFVNLHLSQMSTSNTLIYNFSETLFDGGCRQAYQFRPFIMSQLQSEGQTWILNTKEFPTEEVPLKIKMVVK